MKRWRHYEKEIAVLVSAFGSIPQNNKYEDIKDYINEEFSDIPVYLSFSSRTVLKVLAKQGIHIYKNLPQTLADLDMAGYRNIIVSSLNLFPTDEHEMVKATVKGFRCFSPANIQCTDAVFGKTDSTSEIISAINIKVREQYPDSINLYLAHGSLYFEQPGLQAYFYIKDFLKDINPLNFFCSLEKIYRFKSMEAGLINQFKKIVASKNDSVEIILIPLLLAGGNHFLKDVKEIHESLSRLFTVKIMAPFTGKGNFNLLDLEIVRKTIIEEINNICK